MLSLNVMHKRATPPLRGRWPGTQLTLRGHGSNCETASIRASLWITGSKPSGPSPSPGSASESKRPPDLGHPLRRGLFLQQEQR